MNRIVLTGSRSGVLACALALASFAFGPMLAASSAAPDRTGEAPSPIPWIQDLGEYFEANPDLKDTPGSGWKPYNRHKWFYEQRMLDGQPIPPNARWKAWEQKNRMSAANPSLRANTWFTLGPANFAGRMLSIDFDPNTPSTVYVGGADGGVWKSTDSGTSWTPLSDELPSLAVGALAVSTTNPSVIVIGTGEATPNVDAVKGVGILRSTDGGNTWITTSFSLSVGGNHGFHFGMCSQNGTFIFGASDGLYRSTDDGANWTQVRTGGDWYDGVLSPLDPNKLFVVRGDATPGSSVKVSTDDGATWSKAGTGQPSSFLFGKSKLGISGTTIYCYVGVAGTGGGIYGLLKSTDDGGTWADLGVTSGLPTGQSWYNLSCAADPNNSSRVICGAVTLARSANGGTSFTNVGTSVHVDHHFLKYEPGSNINVWAGSDGGVYRNTSDGQSSSWVSKNNGLITYQFYDICVGNNSTYYVLGGTQDNGTDRWTGTTTWTSSIGADGMVCNIATSDNTTAYGEIQFGDHRKSTNQGLTFSSFNSGITGSGAWVTPVALDANDAIHLLTATSNGIFRSTNGSSWSNVASHAATWIDISPIDGDVAWSIAGSIVHVTTDNGNTWASNTIPFSTGGGLKILAAPDDVNTAWATFSGYGSVSHVAKTTDLGATWSDKQGDLPNMPVNAIAIDPSNPGDIYVGTDIGVWFTRNDGVNWHPVGDTTLPNACVADLEIRNADRKLVAGTHGRGAWELTIPAEIESDPTDVNVSVSPESRNLMLDNPTPNPITERTLIRYAARSSASVTLKVYDVNGRLVSDLAEFERGDGIIRTTPWFANDAPSGVYFAVLQAGAERKSVKITVLK